jgi:phospholipase C
VFLQDVAHDWTSGHQAWNDGNYDRWVPAKGVAAMTYMTRRDLPFHYALADAFTICDAYYCSVIGPTDPNRYHIWTGWLGNDGAAGGPVIDNSEAGYDWSTYPERLQEAGVSWKVYQDIGIGLDAAGSWGFTANPYIGNYGDNSLLYFHQYQNAPAGSPLAQGAKTGTNVKAGGTLFDQLRQDVLNNRLPQVSWIAAPEAYSEHPNWPPNYGAWYISQVLDALTANPDVWSRTVLFINYDENGGFFDHMTPPYPPSSPEQGLSTAGTANEIFSGNNTYASGPYGLGTRVPMIVVSPWSVGGYVCSQVFDHTSLIQFIEQRFGVVETNITAWRRSICGDLRAAFDFAAPDLPRLHLPSTAGLAPSAAQISAGERFDDFKPTPPAIQSLAIQEPGLRHARALPYQLEVNGRADPAGVGSVRLELVNRGGAGACFQVRSNVNPGGPWTYTVEGGKSVNDIWALQGTAKAYDLAVYGPNGFLRRFAGSFWALPATGSRLAARSAAPGGIWPSLRPTKGRSLAAFGSPTATPASRRSIGWRQARAIPCVIRWKPRTAGMICSSKSQRIPVLLAVSPATPKPARIASAIL